MKWTFPWIYLTHLCCYWFSLQIILPTSNSAMLLPNYLLFFIWPFNFLSLIAHRDFAVLLIEFIDFRSLVNSVRLFCALTLSSKNLVSPHSLVSCSNVEIFWHPICCWKYLIKRDSRQTICNHSKEVFLQFVSKTTV